MNESINQSINQSNISTHCSLFVLSRLVVVMVVARKILLLLLLLLEAPLVPVVSKDRQTKKELSPDQDVPFSIQTLEALSITQYCGFQGVHGDLEVCKWCSSSCLQRVDDVWCVWFVVVSIFCVKRLCFKFLN